MTTSFTHTEPILSYYAASRNDHTHYHSLQGTVEVETCIIGGGLSSIGTALPLAQQQHSVALIEAAQIGYGASGCNGGQVIYGYAAKMSSIASMIGLKNAQTLWQWSRQAVGSGRTTDTNLPDRLRLAPCYVHVAIRPRHLHALTEWVKEAAAHYHFHDYQIWNQHQLQQLASERYAGAIFDQQAGHWHPLNYTLGLARAAAATGALLFEHIPHACP